jgi:hypothetical protein
MNPLEPNDPLWNLLGKAREVEVRGNFVPNVLRAVRQEKQSGSRWSEWLSAVWFKPLLAATAALAISAIVFWPSADEQAPVVIAQSTVEDAELIQLAQAMPLLPIETVNEMNALLALDDASAMTDTELAFLLY